MKLIIETKDNKVFINGTEQDYGPFNDTIDINHKIMISIANECKFEPALVLNMPEIFGYDGFGGDHETGDRNGLTEENFIAEEKYLQEFDNHLNSELR